LQTSISIQICNWVSKKEQNRARPFGRLGKNWNGRPFSWIHPVWWADFLRWWKDLLIDFFCQALHFSTEKTQYYGQIIKSKTAHIITTLDQPSWIIGWIRQAKCQSIKKINIRICGINPVKVSYFGIIKNSKDTTRQKWISAVEKLGKQK